MRVVAGALLVLTVSACGDEARDPPQWSAIRASGPEATELAVEFQYCGELRAVEAVEVDDGIRIDVDGDNGDCGEDAGLAVEEVDVPLDSPIGDRPMVIEQQG